MTETTEKKNLWTAIKEEARSFYQSLKKENELFFLVLLTSYVISFLLTKINWIEDISENVVNFRLIFFSLVLWGSAVYLFMAVVDWKKLWKHTVWLLAVGVVIGAVTLFLGKLTTRDDYTVIMGILFCLLCAGKSYRRIVQCVMWAAFITLVVASVSVLIGYTQERLKPENVSPGHSFGIIYPNTWGYIAYLGLMACWYLYLQKKPIITLIVFWAVSALMYFVISCRTIAVLTIGFPILAIISNALTRKKDALPREKDFSFGAALWMIMPLLFLGLTFLLCWQFEWVHKFFYNTALHTMAMRFVQGGMALRTFGFHLFGQSMKSNSTVYYMLNGQAERLYVLDNAFVICAITRGILWMAACMAWLGYADWKGWKNRDHGVLLVSFMMLAFSVMEHPGLDTWYKFVLLYPLAVIGTPEKLNWKFWVKKKKPEPGPEASPEKEAENGPEDEASPEDEPPAEQTETETAAS